MSETYCEHSLAEMDAAAYSGLCALCLKEVVAQLRAALDEATKLLKEVDSIDPDEYNWQPLRKWLRDHSKYPGGEGK